MKIRTLLAKLMQDLDSARIHAGAYLLSETRQEQAANAKHAKLFLARAKKAVLTASESNIFGPVDVAHLTAQIEHLSAELN